MAYGPTRSKAAKPARAAAAKKAVPLKIPPLTETEIAEAQKPEPQLIRVTRPKIRETTIRIVGISPYVQHAFSEKQRKQMEETQRQGQQARGKKTRVPKDFEAVYEAAKHKGKVKPGEKEWCGIPAPAFRNAMISACRLIGYKMTIAKLSIFVEPDGIDANDGTPLVRIIGEPRIHQGAARNANGSADVRWRPLWEEWSADVRISWDEDQFSAADVWNLLLRAGLQVGIGEGRPDSPNSYGLGWGRFRLEGDNEENQE